MTRFSGRLLMHGDLVPGHVEIEQGRIARIEIDPRVLETGGGDGPPIVSPGLIDLHVHGFGGAEPLTDLAGMARALAAAGTTAFLPTLFPRAPGRLGTEATAVNRAAADLTDRGAGAGARVLGLHLEGPFVSPRAAGALPPADLARPAPGALDALLGSGTGDGRGVRAMTVAPELPGALDLIAELVARGVHVSLGHSLASADEARAAARSGARGVTHLFNAMAPFHHRAPGLVGFALADDALHAEIIGDLVHVAAEAIEVALAARGAQHLCLVSDALHVAGTGCDRFHAHGRDHVVRAGAVWFEPATAEVGEEGAREPRLAGSSTGQLEAVRRLRAAGVLGTAEALTMASEAPARALGLEGELGRLVPGARADLLLLAARDLALEGVLLGGEALEPAPGRED